MLLGVREHSRSKQVALAITTVVTLEATGTISCDTESRHMLQAIQNSSIKSNRKRNNKAATVIERGTTRNGRRRKPRAAAAAVVVICRRQLRLNGI